jgi:hypothetical protein
MKTLTWTLWFFLSAGPALAAVLPCATSACTRVGAPAPLIGLGIESAAAVGALLLGSKLFKRWMK